jgi:hypothetical protein
VAEGKGLWVRLEPNHGLEAGAQVHLRFWPETLESRAWQGAGQWFRKGAGAVIAILAVYFILNPFFAP